MAGLTEGPMDETRLKALEAMLADWDMDFGDAEALIAEVRRLRALLAGLTNVGCEYCNPHGDQRCFYCEADNEGESRHEPGCPYVAAVAACSDAPSADRPVSWDMVVYSRYNTTLRDESPGWTGRKVEGREVALLTSGPFPVDVIDGPGFVGSTVRVSLAEPAPQRGGRNPADDRTDGRKPTGH